MLALLLALAPAVIGGLVLWPRRAEELWTDVTADIPDTVPQEWIATYGTDGD